MGESTSGGVPSLRTTPMTFLLDQLIILLQSPTITNFDSYTRPYRKKNDSTHNHVMGLPNHGYERFSSTRSKSSRGGIGVFSRADQRSTSGNSPRFRGRDL